METKQAPRFRSAYSDGSGPEYVTVNGETSFAVTAWGCSCSKPEVTPDHIRHANMIADALNKANDPVREAAPDLLDAVSAAWRVMCDPELHETDAWTAAIAKMDTAIAKARGDQ